jgi:CubicO group peptidase (beta-lactamase class C family)
VDAAIVDLDARVATVMRDTGIPGMAVSVVYKGMPVYQKGFGVTEVGTDNRVDAETAFQIASVSKSVSTSVAAAAMKGGSLSWNDRAARLLPQFRLSNRWVTRNTTWRIALLGSASPACW